MFAPSPLDPHTLLVVGHLLLTLMAAALMVARPLPGSRSRTLPLWIASLVVYVMPGLVMPFAGPPPGPAPDHPHGAEVSDVIQVFLIVSFALQALALREVTHGLRSRTTIAVVVAVAAGFAAVGARALPTVDVLAIAHAVLPLAVWPALRALATQGVGGGAAAVAVVLGALPSWAALVHVGLRGQGPTTTVILFDLLSLFGGSLGLLLWHQGNIQRLLERLATSDALTGALNRHGFMPRLGEELARAVRRERPVAIVACDLDHFKRVNDVHGHDVGDAVLRGFVNRARGLMRSTDLLGRLGGEEFVLVLPETHLADAVQILQRMRLTPMDLPPGAPQVTFSAGVVVASPSDGYDTAALLKLADRRLYAAKVTRDRIVAED